MERTGNFVGGRWTGKVELLPGEFEVFSRAARRGRRPGRLVFTNQRFLWWPSWRRKLEETDVFRIPHETVVSCDVMRPWQSLFLQRMLRLRLQRGESIMFSIRDPEAILPTVRQYMSRGRYQPGELFKSG